MFRSVLLKTLYEKRWMNIGWSLAIFLTVIFIVVLFPTFKESFGVALKDVPESMKAFLGDAADYQTLAGYVDLQAIAQMIVMTIILAVVLFTGLIAGDQSSGTLQSLLYQPISRSRVYIEKYLAGTLIIAASSIALTLGIILGALLINESINITRLVECTFAIWLLTMVYGTLAYAIGAVTGQKGLTGALAGIIAFLTYLVSILATTADSLAKLNYLSPFRYFNNPSVLENGLNVSHALILMTVCAVLFSIGYLAFVKRDIIHN